MSIQETECETETCSRREALAALARYSAVVGGSAATIVSADGLVSAASAYWSAEKLAKFCAKNPTHWRCTGGSAGNSNRVNF